MTSALWLGLRKCKCGANSHARWSRGRSDLVDPVDLVDRPLCTKHGINIFKGSAITPCNLCRRVGPHFRQGQPSMVDRWPAKLFAGPGRACWLVLASAGIPVRCPAHPGASWLVRCRVDWAGDLTAITATGQCLYSHSILRGLAYYHC